jgi:hypothetical protein
VLPKKIVLFLFFFLLTAVSFSQNDSIQNEVDRWIKESTVPTFIVLAGTSTNFEALDHSAKAISKKTGITYQNGLIHDLKRGMIVPDTSSDEIYAGAYYPRRYSSNEISIEMLWYYMDSQNQDTLKEMIILAGIFQTKEEAEKQLSLVKSVVPTAYVKKKMMYMGCMH